MNPITTSITVEGTQYTFRLPTSNEMIQLDLNALKLRGGITDGLSLAYQNSQNLAALTLLCTVPEDVTFGDLPFHVINKLGGGLWKWINSFSKAE